MTLEKLCQEVVGFNQESWTLEVVTGAVDSPRNIDNNVLKLADIQYFPYGLP